MAKTFRIYNDKKRVIEQKCLTVGAYIFFADFKSEEISKTSAQNIDCSYRCT